MIKLIPMTHAIHARWFSLEHESVMGYPLALGAKPVDILYYRTWVSIMQGVPDRWAFRYFIADLEQRCIVGVVGFHTGPRDGVLEVAYHIAPGSRGKGIAVKALSMLLSQSVKTDPELGFTARIVPENAASIKVAEQCGFTFEREGCNEGLVPCVHLSLSAEDARARYAEIALQAVG